MADISTERVLIVGKKGKSTGYYYKEVPANERAPGASEKELGARWGRDSGKADEEGQVTRRGSRTQKVPGALDSAQDKQESRLDEGLDQPDDSSGDRRDLDQPTQLGDDRIGRTSLDQPDDTGGDRHEALSSEDPRLSYATDDNKKGDPSG